MGWEREMTEIVRVLIGDTDYDNERYSDERILRSMLVASYQVIQEVDFDTAYLVSISQSTITPSPVPCNSISDVAFVNLVTLKSTMLILGGEVRIAANSAVDITDGPSKISGKSRYEALKGMLDYAYNQYAKAKLDYSLGVAAPIQSIVGPTTNSTIVGPGLYGENLGLYYSPRDQYY